MFNRSPESEIASATFGDEGVDVRIPFKIPAKGMKDTNETRGKVLRFIDIEEHGENNISDGMKKAVKKRAILKKENAKFLRNRKNAVSVDTINKFTRHEKRAFEVIHVAIRGAEAAFTAKRNKFKIDAMRTAEKSSTVRRVSAMNHLIDVFDHRGSGMEFINNVFIIVSKNGL